ncbi:MAG: hypothetical protein K1X79_00570 [Oligoflexia bacterium]|nr:hypothetical protein [Oligoflexia bacterium]
MRYDFICTPTTEQVDRIVLKLLSSGRFTLPFHALILALIIVAVSAAQAEEPPRKKLIEFGWDEPDTAFLRDNIHRMEQQPFDGCVFHIRYTRPNWVPFPEDGGNFVHEAWGKRAFTLDEVTVAINDLRATPFRSFSDNFVRLNVSPGNVDWFDDFSAITNNVGLLAKVAFEGKAAGIFFDVEHYFFSVFDYSKQKYSKQHNFKEYSEQVRRRGREIMREIQRNFSTPKILLSYSYSLPLRRADFDTTKLAYNEYGLLVPFLDGMLDAANPGTQFIDGFEFAYRYNKIDEFRNAVTEMRQTVLPFVGNARLYSDHFRVGFGLWLDVPNQDNAWSHLSLSNNYFTPNKLAHSLKLALQHTDEYVWIYSQRIDWWRESVARQRVPKEYIDAVRAGRAP